MAVRVAVRHPEPARIELRAIGFDRVTVVPADIAKEGKDAQDLNRSWIEAQTAPRQR
jgi:hypothetical protein